MFQMLFDSVGSLVMCNLFSHALFWSVWPGARSGFDFTLNMSAAEVRLRTMTDTHSLLDLKNSSTNLGFRVHLLQVLCLSFWLSVMDHSTLVLRLMDLECVDLDHVFKPFMK